MKAALAKSKQFTVIIRRPSKAQSQIRSTECRLVEGGIMQARISAFQIMYNLLGVFKDLCTQ